MHDIRWIRDHQAEFDRGLARRGLPPRGEEVLALDGAWRAAETRAQEVLARRNRMSRDIGAAKRRGEDIEPLLRQVETDKGAEAEAAAEAARLRAEIDEILAGLPNLPAADVPDGADETANLLLRRVGEPPRFNFAAAAHEAIGERLGLMDFRRAGKLSGSRFVVLRGDLARLERALGQFMLDLHTREFGYQEISPPLLVRDEVVFGTGPTAQIRRGFVPHDRRVVADPDRRGAADQPCRRRDPRRARAAIALYRVDAVAFARRPVRPARTPAG